MKFTQLVTTQLQTEPDKIQHTLYGLDDNGRAYVLRANKGWVPAENNTTPSRYTPPRLEEDPF